MSTINKMRFLDHLHCRGAGGDGELKLAHLIHLISQQGKARPDKTRQERARPDKTRQDKTRQDKTRRDETKDKIRQDKIRFK